MRLWKYAKVESAGLFRTVLLVTVEESKGAQPFLQLSPAWSLVSRLLAMLCAACELIRKIWLRRRLRWATLGPQYDWTRRRYGSADDAPPLPPYLRDIAIRAADAAARAVGDGAASHAAEAGLVSETGYEPNAALVNFYSGEGDTLCGHQVRPTLHANADATRCGSSRPCYGPRTRLLRTQLPLRRDAHEANTSVGSLACTSPVNDSSKSDHACIWEQSPEQCIHQKDGGRKPQLPRLGAKYRGLTLKTCLRVLNPRL